MELKSKLKAGLLFLGIAGGGVYFYRDVILTRVSQRALVWVAQSILEEAKSKTKGINGLEIEKIEISSGWRELVLGRVHTLTIQIQIQNKNRLLFSGPLEILKNKSSVRLRFDPKLSMSIAGESDSPDPLEVKLEVAAEMRPRRFYQKPTFDLNSVLAVADFPKRWGWKKQGLNLESGKLTLDYRASKTQFTASWKNLEWEKKDVDGEQARAFNLSKFNARVEAGAGVKIVNARFTAEEFEGLWGSHYLGHNLKGFPIEVQWGNQDSLGHTRLQIETPYGNIGASGIDPRNLESLEKASFAWNLDRVPVAGGIALIEKIFPGGFDFAKVQRGVLTSTGEVSGVPFQRIKMKAGVRELEMRAGGAQNRKWGLSGAQIEIDLAGSATALKGKLNLAIPHLRMLKLKSKLETVKANWNWNSKGNIELVFLSDLKLETDLGILQLDRPVFQTGPGEVPLLSTGIHLTTQPLVTHLGSRLCLSETWVPPGQIDLNFPKVTVTPDSIQSRGQVDISLFGGKVVASNLNAYDLSSEVPEWQFDLDWRDIRFDQMSAWLGLGDVDGIFQGYLHDTTLQAWLPTQYDFKFEVVPHNHADVVFSPGAMKNLVRVLSGDEVDQHLPGIADWLAFGWPSRVFGGYDVNYAGLSVYSAEGAILVRTLDSDEVVQKEGRHFFLYGPRFKIPLKSSRYPVVLDAPGMAHLTRLLFRRLGGVREKSLNAQTKEDPKNVSNSEAISQSNCECGDIGNNCDSVRNGQR